ncbi:hypothetical protein HYU23_00835 [Candidatus Woesearchaeota archaeon]|nr:hypothetical protein [Candidatus Woesearchaeota archaeon]
MNKILKFLFFVIIFIFILDISVYGIIEGKENFLCKSKFSGYDCDAIDKPNAEKNNCKIGKLCDGKDCCDSSANLYCCPIKKADTGKSTNPYDFFNIPGVSAKYNKLNSLALPDGINYFALVERSFDPNIKAEALYAQARGLFTVAALRGEYTFLPPSVISEAVPEIDKIPKIVIKEPIVITPGPKEGSKCGSSENYKCVAYDNYDPEQQSCIGNCEENPNFLCCKETSVTTSTSSEDYSFVIGSSFTSPKIRLFFLEGQWQWCKTNIRSIFKNSCDKPPVVLSENSPSDKENFDKDIKELLPILRTFTIIDYKGGLDILLLNLIEIKVKKNIDLALIVENYELNTRDKLSVIVNEKDVKTLERDGQQLLVRSVDLKIGDETFKNVVSKISYKDVPNKIDYEINDSVYTVVLGELSSFNTV